MNALFGEFMKAKISFKLEKHEIPILLFSVIAVIISYALGETKAVMNLAASLVGVVALIYVAKGYVIGQLLCIVFAVLYGIVSYRFAYYGEMITYLCMSAPTALVSLISWVRNPYKESAEVKVASLNTRKVTLLFLVTTAVTVAFWFILGALGTANLLVSTFSVATSFIAASLTVLRSPYYAIGYSANDIVLIILWSLAALKDPSSIPMIICFVAFLVNDGYGFINWKRMQKRQSA